MDPFEAAVVHPFSAPEVIAAAATAHRLSGFPSRAEGMREIFGDVLPPDVLQRATKARFNTAMFSAYSREFAREWRGEGSEGLPIDHVGLRRTWAATTIDARSFSLLQGLWCHSTGTGPIS